MCQSYSKSSTLQNASNEACFSLLDNNRNCSTDFTQSELESAHLHLDKSSFIKAAYRKNNILLASKLAASRLADHAVIEKTVSKLRNCSRVSVVEVVDSSNAKIVDSSKRCKSMHCPICARKRSSLYANNFSRFLKSDVYTSCASAKNLYFLTLTWKYQYSLSMQDNIKQFHAAFAKLKRRKAFLDLFYDRTVTVPNLIATFETTFKDDSIHYHAHVIVSAPSLRMTAASLQASLSALWLKVTKHSYIVDFSLIKPRNGQTSTEAAQAASKEVFKYSVKFSNVKSSKSVNWDIVAEYITVSKNAKKVVRCGVFMSLVLNAKVKSDVVKDVPAYFERETVKYACLTSSISSQINVHGFESNKTLRSLSDVATFRIYSSEFYCLRREYCVYEAVLSGFYFPANFTKQCVDLIADLDARRYYETEDKYYLTPPTASDAKIVSDALKLFDLSQFTENLSRHRAPRIAV